MEDSKGTIATTPGLITLQTEDIYKENGPGGCRVRGTIKLLKVKGNFHIALGSNRYNQLNPGRRHTHLFTAEQTKGFITNHVINSLVIQLQIIKL